MRHAPLRECRREQRQLKLVLTREGVGYGGVDITADVEKALNITEKATPTPGT